MEQAVVFAGLSPHPPVIIPNIGRQRLAQVAQTVDGLRRVMKLLLASAPESVVLISPHAPRDPKHFSAYTGPRIRGDFTAFGAPQIALDVSNDLGLLSRMTGLCREKGLSTWMLPAGRRLDHGALVPLHFLLEAGCRSPLVVLGLPFDLSVDHLRFGACIAEAARQLSKRIAIIASGDMSHRLTPDAPYAYHPRARLYDEQLAAAVAKGAVDEILNIDPALRDVAGEDTYQSLLVALGSIGGRFHNPEVCSYQSPFGVGYLTAVLANYGDEAPSIETSAEASAEALEEKKEGQSAGEELTELARRSVETFVKEKRMLTPPERTRGKLRERSGVFVCIKKRDGALRGCVGTTSPTQKNIAEEIIHNAVSAATKDSRFPAIRSQELNDLLFSVDILSPLEIVSGLTELDPQKYGVVVESEDQRRGLLLPNLAGIDTAEQQVALAMKKASIPPDAPVKFYRFTVERITETQ